MSSRISLVSYAKQCVPKARRLDCFILYSVAHNPHLEAKPARDQPDAETERGTRPLQNRREVRKEKEPQPDSIRS